MPDNEAESSMGRIGRSDEELDAQAGQETPEVTIGGLDALLGILNPKELGDALSAVGYDAHTKVSILVDIAKARNKGALKAVEALDETIKTALRMAGILDRVRLTKQGVDAKGAVVTAKTDMEMLVKEQQDTFSLLRAAEDSKTLIEPKKEDPNNGEDSESERTEGGGKDSPRNERLGISESDPFTLVRRPATEPLGKPEDGQVIRTGIGPVAEGRGEGEGGGGANPRSGSEGPVVSSSSGISSEMAPDSGSPPRIPPTPPEDSPGDSHSHPHSTTNGPGEGGEAGREGGDGEEEEGEVFGSEGGEEDAEA